MTLPSKVNFSPTTPAAPAGKHLAAFQSDASSPVNANFYVPNAWRSIATKSADYTAVQDDSGKFLPVSGSHTVTLPSAGSPVLPAEFGSPLTQDPDWELYIVNVGSGTVTVSGDGVSIYGAGSSPVSSFTLAAGASAMVRVSNDGLSWVAFLGGSSGGSGTVTSVAMTGDGTVFNSSVSGSPVTTSGTFAPSLKTQSANTFLRGPNSGSAATPTYGPIVNADLPAMEFGNGLSGKPSDGQVVFLAPAPAAGQFSANFSGSAGSVGTNPASSAVYTVKNGATTIGTITISSGGSFTFATTGGTAKSFSKDDRISITAPSPQDSTLADVCLRLEATRS